MRLALVCAVWLAGPGLFAAGQEPARPFGYGSLPRGAWACLGAPRFVGDTPASCVAFSPDGKLLATGTHLALSGFGVGPAIHVWDLATGQEIHTLRSHTQQVVALRFTPDGKRLVSASADSGIIVWDVVRGREERQFDGHNNAAITGLELTADGKLVVSSGKDGTLRVWEFAIGRELRRMDCQARGISLAPDGRTLAVAAGAVLFWDIHTGQQLRQLGQAKGAGVEGVRFSPDGKTLAVLDDEGQVALWDLAAGKERLRLKKLPRPTASMAFSHDGKVLATGGYGYDPRLRFLGDRADLKLWDTASGDELGSCEHFTSDIVSVAFSPNDQVLASAGDFTSRLWDWKKGRELPRFTGHSQEVTALTFAPDGRTLFSSSKDGTIRLWDAIGCKEQAVLRGHTKGILSLGLTPDGKTLASGGPDGTVRIWDVADRGELRKLAADHADARCLAFAPDGKTLVTGDAGLVGPAGPLRVWDWQAGKELRRLTAQPGAQRLVFTPGGKTVVVGFRPQLSVLEIESGKVWHRFQAHGNDVQALASLPDGTLVTSGGDDQVMPLGKKGGFRKRRNLPRLMSVRLWDARTGAKLYEFGTAEGYHTALAVSPDGRLIAASFEKFIHVWEASTRELVGEFQGHRGHVSALAFSPDGRTLASGGADGAILFWDLTGRRQGNQIVGPALKPAELDALWTQLGEEDGRRALWTLAAAPAQAVPFLRKRMPAVPKKADGPDFPKLIADLDAIKFAVRQRATAELEKLGEAAVPALRLALEGNPSPELAKRVQTLLDKANSPNERVRRLPAVVVQLLRAVETLERVGTPEAIEVLRGIAAGEPIARETREAQAALQRLALQSRSP